jgi:hypothetical protein
VSIFAGIISILDWAKEKIPIQDRKERWKNELDNLTKEKEKLLQGECDVKKAQRLDLVNSRIAYLNQLLRNQN